MKEIYMKPSVEIVKINTESLLTSASIGFGEDGANPNEALGRGNGLWDDDEE